VPAFTYNAETEKEQTIRALRPKWAALKETHKAALTANKITFNDNLGKALDNRAALWKAVHDAKAKLNPADKSQLAAFRTKLNALKANAKTGHTTVAAYWTSVRKLNVAATKPAYTALDKALVEMDKAFTYDQNYADNM